MQHFYCVFCQRIFLKSEVLTEHLYTDHKDDLSNPDKREEWAKAAFELLIGLNKEETVNASVRN